MKKLTLGLIALFFFSTHAMAKERVAITGQVRPATALDQVKVSFFYKIEYNFCDQIALITSDEDDLQKRYDKLKEQTAKLGGSDLMSSFGDNVVMYCSAHTQK